MHPKDLSIRDFSYVLPQDRIAQQPLAERDESKLLVYHAGKVKEDIFSNIISYLPEGAMIFFNDTKVIHARILFKNEQGAEIEILLLEPVSPFRDMQLAIFQHSECEWRCLVGNVKKWREDFLSRKIKMGDEEGILQVKVKLKGKIENDFLVHFSWKPESLSFSKVLEATGFVPLPPYIKRKADAEDAERYQTVYAFQDGSVAAPTAGLHFTEKLFHGMNEKDLHPLFITLHVSAGTFMPVKSELMSDHAMHAEQFVIRKEMIVRLLSRKDQAVIAVGSTCCRTLESLYWLGTKLLKTPDKDFIDLPVFVDQWEPYETLDSYHVSILDSLNAVLKFLSKKKSSQLIGETKLIIAPGYNFKIVDGLITNFHLPKSTLLLLIAAFIGDDWKKVYAYAMDHSFRFLSYGDGSLLWRK
ncbi:MAG: S-adenosylmethionine:tRNA ribosyltransferase-isomerase [Chitinophagales bacterium]|nr:S-adenosylmethionine:tRNA ribosyltransferase-isomerase [Chitinophagales bacterium]